MFRLRSNHTRQQYLNPFGDPVPLSVSFEREIFYIEFDAGGSWMFGPGGKLPLHYHLFQDGSPKELPQVP